MISRRSSVHILLAVVLLTTLACSAASRLVPPTPVGTSTAPTVKVPTAPNVAAVALRVDVGASQLSSFVGPITDTWNLATGSYIIFAVNEDGLTLAFPEELGQPLTWPSDFQSAGAVDDPQRARAVTTLVSFLMQAEDAKLTALQISSADFSVPLFTAQPGQAELDQLYAQYAKISPQEADVTNALDSLLSSISYNQGPSKLAMPARDWKETLFGFFGYAGNAGKRARDRILKISQGLSPGDKADAFNGLREGFKGNATNYDDFLDQLRSGALDDQAAQIESDLRLSPGFAAAAQDANATTAQIVHQEGGQLVSKGADMEAFVSKLLLNNAFPGIAEGWDMADKAIKWADFARTLYTDPLGGTVTVNNDVFKEKIKEHILGDLKGCCEKLDEVLADGIADKIAGKIMETLPNNANAIRATQTPEVAAPPPPAATQVALRTNLSETVTGGAETDAEYFDTALVLTADYETGTVIGSLEGVSNRDVQDPCYNTDNPSEIYDYAWINFSYTYSAQVDGTLDVNSGAFTASISPSGNVDFKLTQPFTDSHCISHNSYFDSQHIQGVGPFSGSGTISGVINPTGQASVTTDWQYRDLRVTGSWSGQGQITP